jgi:hypothetical protein
VKQWLFVPLEPALDDTSDLVAVVGVDDPRDDVTVLQGFSLPASQFDEPLVTETQLAGL